MNTKMKRFIYFTIFIICLILSLTTVISYATMEDNGKQEYGKAYQEWIKLPETEKKKTLTPRMYDIPFSSMELKATNEQLEEKYNLADHIDITVENQGGYGLCWAFATIKSMETNVAVTTGEYYDFSEMYLGFMVNKYRGTQEDDSIQSGANFYEVENLFKSNLTSGPVLESEIPYNTDEENKQNIDNVHVVKKVQEYANFPSIYKESEPEENIEIFRKEVKNHIKKYGSVYATIKIASTESDFEKEEDMSKYFNSETNSLYYNGEGHIDHAISIVGWDDNYSKDNFVEGNKPQNDGAYIALNSWGEHWGNNGYFYISYEDVLVEQDMNGFVELIDANMSITKEIKWKDTTKNDVYEMKKVNEIKKEWRRRRK